MWKKSGSSPRRLAAKALFRDKGAARTATAALRVSYPLACQPVRRGKVRVENQAGDALLMALELANFFALYQVMKAAAS